MRPDTPGSEGDTFGVDLFELLKAGQQYMPYIGDQILSANHALADTNDYDQAMSIPLLEESRNLVAVWSALRNELQSILGENGEHILSAGRAMVLCVEEYSETDTDNKDPPPRSSHQPFIR